MLHLGNARTFLLTWLDIRTRGGTLLLRIEDIDGPRVKSGAERATLEDLAWLGLDWDGAPLRQSEHCARYRAHVDGLIERGLAYPCICTRKEIEDAASAPHEDWLDAAPYPGTCRGRFPTLAAARAASGREPAVRYRVDVDRVPFVDGFRGAQDGRIRGDFVIQKRDGEPAYQLAVVADDHAQGITRVMRGDDLVPSTPRQLLLYAALGWEAPQFAHLPLLVGEDGRRLAKRHGDTSLRSYRERGIDAESVLGWLAARSGLLPARRRCSATELLARCRDRGGFLDAVPRDPLVVHADEIDGARG